jgi:hypothetical protein
MTTYNTHGGGAPSRWEIKVTMSTKPSKFSEADASKEDELEALIYRESQHRKKEAAALDRAKKRKKSTSSSSRRSTSTRQATAGHKVTNSDEMIANWLSSKRSRHSTGNDEEQKVSAEVARKKYRYECSAGGCTNHVVNGGVCIRHGAKIGMEQRSNDAAVKDAPM